MVAPSIAVVGSADPQRTTYDPPLRNVDQVKQACEQLGRELAKAGYRIVVYSSNPAFIEADIVRGYVTSGKAQSESIQIRYPRAVEAAGPPRFPEQDSHQAVFDEIPDEAPNWEVSFYRSLTEVDGLLLLGGANSALITGVIADASRKPLVAVATFGGSAQNVWSLSMGQLASKDERRVMGLPTWREDSAAKLVRSLGEQRLRLQKEEAERLLSEKLQEKRLRRQAGTAGLLVLTAVVLTAVGFFGAEAGHTLFGALFFGVPLLAGAAGSLARNLFEYVRGVSGQGSRSSLAVTVLGMIAGLIAAALFVLAQMASTPNFDEFPAKIPPGLNRLIPFELVIGFVAGLTLEAVFTKLQGMEVIKADSPLGARP